jgi:hypothetical protein
MPISTMFAYIDPMSGAIVLQLIIAAIAGTAAFFRRSIWGCVRCLFRRKETPQDAASTTEN